MATREARRQAARPGKPAAGRRRAPEAPAAGGNQARQRALRAQAKLDVRPAGDAYEQEADRIADDIVSAKEPGADGPAKANAPATTEAPAPEDAEPVQGKPEVTPVQEDDAKPPEAGAEEEEPAQRTVEAGAEKEKEEPVQKKTEAGAEKDKKEPEPVQKKTEAGAEKDKEEPVQKKTEAGAEKEEPKPVQKKAENVPLAAPPEEGTKPEPHAHLEQRLGEREAGGMPLDPATRGFFERCLGRGLDTVRVHTDAEAARLAKDIGAQAFTRGAHVYFGSGRYDPGSPGGRRLLAHELVHVVQQGAAGTMPKQGADAGPATARPPPVATGVAGVQRKASNLQPDPVPAGTFDAETGEPTKTGTQWTIRFAKLELPDDKWERHQAVYAKELTRAPGDVSRSGAQRGIWLETMKDEAKKGASKLTAKVGAGGLDNTGKGLFRLPKSKPEGISKGAKELHGAKGPKEIEERFFHGTPEEVAAASIIPYWDRGKSPRAFDVDHITEVQAGGSDTDINNMELLDASTNSSHGSILKGIIEGKRAAFAKKAQPLAKGNKAFKELQSADLVKQNATLVFTTGAGGGGGAKSSPDLAWSRADIAGGAHLERLEAVDPSEAGKAGNFTLLAGMGGFAKQLPKDSANKVDAKALEPIMNPYKVVSSKLEVTDADHPVPGATLGSVKTRFQMKGAKGQPGGTQEDTFDIVRVGSAAFVGSIDAAKLTASLRQQIRSPKLSPVEVDSAQLTEKGVVAPGRIKPSLSKFLKEPIEFTLQDGGLDFEHTWSAGGLEVPKPFELHGGSVTVGGGSDGTFRASGQVDFGIQKVGDGSLGIEVATGDAPISVKGEFVFDPSLAENAKVEITYTKDGEGGKWAGKGSIELGKRKGIKKGSLEVEFKEGVLKAEGSAELDVPGFESGSLKLEVGPDGILIGGGFKLSKDIKGLKGGELKAELSNKGGDGFKVKASGAFQSGIPGFDTTLEADYDDGALTIKGISNFSKGMLSGKVEAGVTNSKVGEDGLATGGGTGSLRPFGGGEATVKLTPWLQGTAAIRLNKKGEVELKGEVALPASLQVFPRKELEKELLSVAIDAPIVGVAVAGQRVGIFLTIGGALSAKAGIGPGTLEDTKITVEYTPSNEAATHVSGSAKLVVPADAGLRLAVHAGIGAGIPLVSATAGLEIGGELGIKGKATAGVNVDWRPGKGLKMHAEADFEAQPSFTFDVSGYAKVEAGIGPFKADLYSQKWSLASFQYGSGMAFGVNFPVDYEQDKAFDVSLDDVHFRKPNIQVGPMIKNLVKEIV
ncbi:MAG: hypothetical protein QOD77_273 [Thermoplasmata archaeon]|jgi:chemotaxis protein histidine kinase CheA|nr:hypothetical protein [Thermoplasmata archaeon]